VAHTKLISFLAILPKRRARNQIDKRRKPILEHRSRLTRASTSSLSASTLGICAPYRKARHCDLALPSQRSKVKPLKRLLEFSNQVLLSSEKNIKLHFP
jgi:hypothetical protein